MIDTVKQLLSSPTDAIATAKRRKSLTTSLGILAVDWVAIALALAALLMGAAAKIPVIGGLVGITGGVLAVGVAILGFLFCLFLALPAGLVMEILSGRRCFFEALTAIAYGLFAPSLGLLVAILLSFIPVIGGIAAFIIIIFSVAIGIATGVRAVNILFGVDLLTAVIGVVIVYAAVMVALYFLLIPMALSGLWALPSLPLRPGI